MFTRFIPNIVEIVKENVTLKQKIAETKIYSPRQKYVIVRPCLHFAASGFLKFVILNFEPKFE